MEITPDGKTVYVVDSGGPGGTVTPISTATNKPGKPIKVAGNAYGAAITPDGKTLYIANASTPGAVTPISTATNTAGPPIKAGVSPRTLVVAPGTPAR